jgi:hypothetical protein
MPNNFFGQAIDLLLNFSGVALLYCISILIFYLSVAIHLQNMPNQIS